MISRLLSRTGVMLFALLPITTELTFAEEFVIKLKTKAIQSNVNPEDLINQQGKQFQIAKKKAQILFSDLHISITDQLPQANLVLIDTKNADEVKVAEQIKRIRNSGMIEYIVPNIKFHAFEAPNDPRIGEQWALEKVNAPKAWDTEKGNSDVVVAVIDTGIDLKHEDLAARIVKGWDFINNNNTPNDKTSQQNPGHGTHCAGIIGAISNNGKGVSGIAQVSLMPLRFLDEKGSGDLMNGAKAIRYAADNGAHIISASWGATVPREGVTPLLEAIEHARSKGVLFVAAAANDGSNNDSKEVYPANAGFDNVISVAASDPSDAKPQWSNFGSLTVDLASPGLNILSTVPKGYAVLSGTSMATPLVAGMAALVYAQAKAKGQILKPEEVKAILQASGTKVDIETACNCRVDAAKAIETVANEEMVVVPNAGALGINESRSFRALGGKAPFTFSSSDEQVATIDNQGKLVAKDKGTVVVSVTDALGHTAQSCELFVGKEREQPVCDSPLCAIICQMFPELPICQ